MHNKILVSLLFLLLTFPILSFSQNLSPSNQELTKPEKENIIEEIDILFEKSIKAGESLDITGMTENVNDTIRAGFIDNGSYFNSFDKLMDSYKLGVKGLQSQKMDIVNKQISVLSDNVVLLTASGVYSAKIADGRELKGKFAWSFIYKKINNDWKLIHSHMSNPQIN